MRQTADAVGNILRTRIVKRLKTIFALSFVTISVNVNVRNVARIFRVLRRDIKRMRRRRLPRLKTRIIPRLWLCGGGADFAPLTLRCKSDPCASKKAMEWQKANPEADEAIRKRRLETIKVERPNWSAEKKAQHNERSKKRYHENWEHCREIARKSKQKEKDKDPETFRAKSAMQCGRRRCNINGYPTDISIDDWRMLLNVFERKCAFCGGKPEFLDLDHVVPINLGGFNVVGNIVPICRPCNSQKSRYCPVRFAKFMNVDLMAILEKAKVRDSSYPICADTYKLV